MEIEGVKVDIEKGKVDIQDAKVDIESVLSVKDGDFKIIVHSLGKILRKSTGQIIMFFMKRGI